MKRMHFLWPNKALWKLDQIRPIRVSHLGIFGEQNVKKKRGEENK